MSPDSSETREAGAARTDLDAWVTEFERLERSLDDEHGLFSGWEPPASLVPIPESLRARAERLLARQEQRLSELQTRAEDVKKHLRALNTVPPAKEHAAVFLDVTG
ncbi:hypothetical protein [Ruicaihuangia caeni]|uniref:Uncharacterized protein n=1 Tax=Ruicaihuangia caeni TaxID=3042517 RepID=A0AAW6T355_9MICO|nr:hypothetical protein [Klugiella sp. YN-L-19]MDI2097874.1 hypothetical protein [Klugiella sp. YN-L-19]